MVKFITLQTNHGAYNCLDSSAHAETGCNGGCDTRRRVSIAYSDKRPDVANLLGNLEHQEEFTRADLVTFARAVLAAFETETDDLLARVARNSERSRAIANGGNHDDNN
jgi:hypothetical protein